MTTFSLLEQKFSDSASVQLFHVQEDNCQSWLVQSIHRRLTCKWFYDYNSAKSYYDHKYFIH